MVVERDSRELDCSSPICNSALIFFVTVAFPKLLVPVFFKLNRLLTITNSNRCRNASKVNVDFYPSVTGVADARRFVYSLAWSPYRLHTCTTNIIFIFYKLWYCCLQHNTQKHNTAITKDGLTSHSAEQRLAMTM